MNCNNYCASCTYLKDKAEDDGKFWCDYKYEYVYANEACCYKHCPAYDRSDRVSESYFNFSKEKQTSGGCYITTITCEILGFNDDNYYLNILRHFRDNYLCKDEKNIDILKEYDIIGPIIAEKLRNDANNKQIAENLFNLAIKNVCKYINMGKYNEATLLYLDMTNLLIKGYDIKEDKDYSKFNVDIKKSGHGKLVLK